MVGLRFCSDPFVVARHRETYQILLFVLAVKIILGFPFPSIGQFSHP